MKLRDDPEKLFKYVANIHCDGYDIDDENREVVSSFIKYFTIDATFEKAVRDKKISLKRGNCLLGNTGIGKATLFEICQVLVRNILSCFTIIKCSEFVNKFYEKGPESYKLLKGNILFKNLGAEGMGIYYGIKQDVMSEIIDMRYDLWKKTGIVTHFTSTLNPQGFNLE